MNFLPYVESVKTNTQQPELNTTAQSKTSLGTAGIGVDTPDTNLSVTPIIPATPRTETLINTIIRSGTNVLELQLYFTKT